LADFEAVAKPLGMSQSIPYLLGTLAQHAATTPPPEKGTDQELMQAENAYQTLVAKYGEDEAFALVEDAASMVQCLRTDMRDRLWTIAGGHSAPLTVALARTWRSRTVK